MSNKDKTQAAGAEQSAENVNKIRDIIFGANMREYEERFNQLDEELGNQIKRLRDDTDKRMDKFEDYVKSELSKLGEKLTTEKRERIDEEKSIGNDMSSLENRLTQAIGDVDAQLAHDAQEIRDNLRSQVKELMDSMRQLQDELSENLNKQSGALRDAKVDRAGLSDMFTELAMRLNGDLELPKGQD